MSLKTDKAFMLAEVKSGMTRTWGAVGRAFTLAEVLITLGIIGVVAVMVVVPFIKDIKDKDLATSSTVFEKRFEEALKVMNSQDTLAGYDKTEDFVQSLAKNFKISKVCKNTELNKCFSQTIQDAEKNKIKTNNFRISDNFGVNFDTNVVGLRFANGVSALLAYDPNCESNPTNNAMPVMSCISMIYDVNGNGRPNKISSDVRLLNASLVDVDGSNAVIAKINGVKITKIADSTVYGYINCKDTESEDNKKYCNGSTDYSNDFLAGAEKYCGGKEKMATPSDLIKIAQYLYNDNSMTSANSYSGLTLDTNKATELQGYGFPSTFSIWSSSVTSSVLQRSIRSFSTNSTTLPNAYRNNSSLLAVCVKH